MSPAARLRFWREAEEGLPVGFSTRQGSDQRERRIASEPPAMVDRIAHWLETAGGCIVAQWFVPKGAMSLRG